MKEFWDKRYSEQTYAYGSEPNEFFKSVIDQENSKGKALFPAEGEGRNAIYAATLGWDVTAFDLSSAGKDKALGLAAEKGVHIDYHVGPLEELNLDEESFDIIVLIFSHFHPLLRKKYHHELITLLKPGGKIIMEVFSKDHLEFSKKNPKAGGPPDAEFLLDIETTKKEFEGLKPILLSQETVYLNEGHYHIGDSSVIRFIGQK
jgi:SAM-dependent methyltransferase